MKHSIVQRALAICVVISLACTGLLMADTYKNPNFKYVGRTNQYHNDSSKIGQSGSQFYEIIDPVTLETIDSGMTIPEPASAVMLGLGGLTLLRRRR